MKQFMVATFSDLALRVILAFLFSGILDAAIGIWLAWPVGWCIGTGISICFYKKLLAKK